MSFSLKGVAKSIGKALIPDQLGIGIGDSQAASGFNVQKMVSSLNKSGVAKASHFEVWVFGSLDGSDYQRDMALRIDSIDLPGRTFGLTEHKFTNIGPVNKMPTSQTYSDVTATIMLSEDLREKQYFESWHDRMINTGAYEASAVTEQERMLAEQDALLESPYVRSKFGHRYFDYYAGRVEIRQYGAAGDLKSVHTLQEAYPIFISPIAMNWADDQPAKMSVTFAYRNYKVVFNQANQPGLGGGFSFSLGKNGLKFGARLPGVGNVSFGKGGVSANLSPLKKKIFSSIGL